MTNTAMGPIVISEKEHLALIEAEIAMGTRQAPAINPNVESIIFRLQAR